jgi:hypothetical protein
MYRKPNENGTPKNGRWGADKKKRKIEMRLLLFFVDVSCLAIFFLWQNISKWLL